MSIVQDAQQTPPDDSLMPSPEDHNLSADLLRILASHDRKGISVRDVVETMGDRGFGVLLVLIALPSALPIPAIGYSIPFGLMLLILGVGVFTGRKTPWLPKWALNLEIPRKTAETMVSWAVKFLSKIEYMIKRRMEWAAGAGGRMFAGTVIILMAILMMIPIPFTNTFPSFVIFLVGVGMTEKDGLFFLASAVLGALAVVVYVVAGFLILTLGVDAIMGFFGKEAPTPE
ncbi:MAG: exopolysaccharide biosynthesis protein [Verrucomicrobiales bacterium]